MSRTYDAIVIGAGHNGLTAAAYLVRAGRSVLVLERREVVGGAAATEEFAKGFRVDAYAHRLGALDGRLLEELGLGARELELVRPDPARVSLSDGRALVFSGDPTRTAASIRAVSPHDAERWPAFCARIADAVRFVDGVRRQAPPKVPAPAPRELMGLAALGLGLRRQGRQSMMETLRLLPMSATELAEEWFESDALQGAIGGAAITRSSQGPGAAGTAFELLNHLAVGDAPAGGVVLVRGGIGRVAGALAGYVRAHGGEIRPGATVDRIVTERGRATAVALAGGETVRARCVLSSLDPKHTLLGLVEPEALSPELARAVGNIRMAGVCAKVHLALSELPRFSGVGEAELRGVIAVAPSLNYLERAHDDAKYGGVSRHPFLEAVIPTLTDASLAPAGRHVMSVLVQYAPYHLAEGTWGDARNRAVGDTVVATLAQFAPNLPGAVLERQVLSPLDLEHRLGSTEGTAHHGEMSLDQLFFMRPVPGWSQYRMPLHGLYLCGAGAHPGGGVTGAPGRLAAHAVLRDLKAGAR
jgi:phytoene dehydrogenase-like protein